MASVLSRFSFVTAAEKQLKQQKHCKKHCFLVVSLDKVVFREGNCQGDRIYEPTQLNTLLERSNAEIKKKTWLNLGNDDSISSKVIQTQTEQFLELFSWTLNFFAP